MREALKQEFVTKYLAQDGLCVLRGETPRILHDGTSGVVNDNGILFATLGYFMFVGDLSGADTHRFMSAVTNLTIAPGLYSRRPDDATTPEAHDNYSAIAAGSVLFDQTFARDICDYGEKYGWSFTNQSPGSWSFKQLRQGGDIAFYKICAGRIPYPTEMAWLCLGLLHSVLWGWSSQWNLAWLKLRTLPLAFDRYAVQPSWGWVTLSFHLTRAICSVITKKRSIFPRSFVEYFGADHVISRAALLQ